MESNNNQNPKIEGMENAPSVAAQVDTAKFQKKKLEMEKRKNEITEPLFRPWDETKSELYEKLIWEEPCFSGMKTIKKSSKKQRYLHDNSFKGKLYRLYYSIFELPIFGWSEQAYVGIKNKSLLPLRKFLFCFFVKLCGFPLYIAYISIRIIYMMLKAFFKSFKVIFCGTINTVVFVVSFAFIWAGRNPPEDSKILALTYMDKGVVKSYHPYLHDSILSMFGLSIPFHTMSKTVGDKYGRGQMGVFIFIVMAVSSVIITLTGINIAVIGLVFFYFLFKTLFGIRYRALGKDLRQGGNE